MGDKDYLSKKQKQFGIWMDSHDADYPPPGFSCPHETSTRVAINNKLTFLSDVFKKTENHQYPLP